MKAIVVVALASLPWMVCAAARAAESTEPAAPIEAEITVTRLSATAWRVDYRLSRPVAGIDFGPPVERYRADGWRIATPGLEMRRHDGAERLVSAGGTFDRARLEVSLYSAFPPDNYVPAARFSDGGAALFLGFLGGDVILSAGMTDMRERYLVRGRSGEVALAPAGAEKGARVFAYFGPEQPTEAGRARLIVDPAAPDWLVNLLRRTVTEVTPVYENRLARRLDAAPLVLIAAGEIDGIDGYSTKGGAINGQIMMTLRGRALAQETDELRHSFSLLMAHELAHLWQESRSGKRFNDREPWIHEGGAEALAVAALAESGLWSEEEARADTRRAEQRCAEERGGATLEEAFADGRWGAVYPCGQALFASSGRGLFALWAALIRAAERRGMVYSQALLDEVAGDLETMQERR